MFTQIEQTIPSLLSEMDFNCPEAFAHVEGFAFQAFEAVVCELEITQYRYDYIAYSIHGGSPVLIDRKRKPLQRTNEDIADML